MSMQRKAPTRRVSDHYHPDVWMRDEQHRFEDGLTEELKEMRSVVSAALQLDLTLVPVSDQYQLTDLGPLRLIGLIQRQSSHSS